MGGERLSLFDFSLPIYRRENVIVVPTADGQTWGVKDLAGRTITGDKGTYIENLIERTGVNVRIMTTSSKEEAMGLLKAGDVSACLMPRAVALYLGRKLDLPIRVVGVGDAGSPVVFAFPKSGSAWRARFDRAIGLLKSSGRLDAILAAWSR